MSILSQMVNYYGVKIGVKPAVYESWTECELNVRGYPNAQYKKFTDKQDALKYVKSGKNKKINTNTSNLLNKQLVSDNYDFNLCVNIYTDGSCKNNGKSNSVAGCGVYFGSNNPNNISCKLKIKSGYKLTNNRAELKAILIACKKILQLKIFNPVIHTDSKYCIMSLLSKNINEKNESTPNYDYVMKGYNILQSNPNIKLHYIKAHTKKQDVHSVGNHNADLLANLAVENTIKNTLTFGKYKGTDIEEIYFQDIKYLFWCLENVDIQYNFIKEFIENKLEYKIVYINDKEHILLEDKVYTINNGQFNKLVCIKKSNGKYYKVK